ncbi:MAG: DNA repair protein RecN [Alphaproteobacteria bacterium]|jgi:DNA repair protein RecN (Recombination protein N)|nr:DNA repair protein RecN [Alphaproteobacteria bacterium]
MLKSLHIKNIVLIKDITINFFNGFSVFSGETGAGKSILLDSLSLALGERANYNLIRKGSTEAEVVACFEVSKSHKSIELLKDNSIGFVFEEEINEEIILRRVISSDGKSKSFINDTPVSINFLRQLSATLIDIHGQFDNQRLMNPSQHREILDSFILDKTLLEKVAESWNEYKESKQNLEKKLSEIAELQKEKEYIEYALHELVELNPKENEEKALLEKKHLMQNGKKILNSLQDIDKNIRGTDMLSNLHKSMRLLENIKNLLNENPEVDKLIDSFDNSYTKLNESIESLEDFKDSLDFNESELSAIEERILDLRSLAKKHKILSEDLPNLKEEFSQKLATLSLGENLIDNIKHESEEKYRIFLDFANQLSQKRVGSAKIVDTKVNAELAFLKLQSAEFFTLVEKENEGEFGIDKITFKVKTNKGADWGDLNKIASGGEMARFMLALKIVLAEVDIINTIILDEIDIGVGGEVAESIGRRLLYLSQNIQTIVVTHSHQVAASGNHHYKVLKEIINDEVLSKLILLNNDERIQEIARMLSGEVITPQAIATAKALLNQE